jgi:hypothetical protein
MRKNQNNLNSKEKEKSKGLINFINSIDFMNKDISNYFKEYNIIKEYNEKDINLNNYIIEFNNRIENKDILIKNENVLYK